MKVTLFSEIGKCDKAAALKELVLGNFSAKLSCKHAGFFSLDQTYWKKRLNYFCVIFKSFMSKHWGYVIKYFFFSMDKKNGVHPADVFLSIFTVMKEVKQM